MIGDLRPSLEADAKKYGVATTRTAYPDGVAGARMVLQEMGRRIREGMIAPSMRAFAEMVVRNWARVPVAQQISDRKAAQIFLDYVREHVRYRSDPDGTEFVQSAPVTLCIPGAPMCIPIEDCDGLTIALGSLMGAYGMQIRIMKQSFGDSNVEHVLIVFKDGDNGWLPADPSAPGKEVGWRASATKEVIVNPADPASLNLEGQPEAIFVGVGRIGSIGECIQPKPSLLPTLIYPSTVKDAQARMLASLQATDAAVNACVGLDASTRTGWKSFLAAATQFAQEDPGIFGLGSRMDQVEAYGYQLCLWQERLAAAKCTSLPPEYNTEQPPAPGPPAQDWLSALKWVAGATAVVAVAYTIAEVLPFVPRHVDRTRRETSKAAKEARKLMRRRRRWVG